MPKADAPTLADKAAKVELKMDAIRLLLAAALPKREVTKRPPTPLTRSAGTTWPGGTEHFDDAGEPRIERQPRGFDKLRGKGRSTNRSYKWVGVDVSRYGTFRHYMLTDIIKAHTSTAEALKAHKASGRYADQTINFSWAAKEGYIEFTS